MQFLWLVWLLKIPGRPRIEGQREVNQSSRLFGYFKLGRIKINFFILPRNKLP